MNIPSPDGDLLTVPLSYRTNHAIFLHVNTYFLTLKQKTYQDFTRRFTDIKLDDGILEDFATRALIRLYSSRTEMYRIFPELRIHLHRP